MQKDIKSKDEPEGFKPYFRAKLNTPILKNTVLSS